MIRRIVLLSTMGGAAAILATACGSPASLQPIDGVTGNAAGDAMGQAAEQDAAGYDITAAAGPMAATSGGNPCISRSGDWSDGDGDGVPTDGIVTFTNCTKSGSLNGYTLSESLNGSVEIKDPTPNLNDPGVFDETDQLKFDRTVTSSAGVVVYLSDIQDAGTVEGSIPVTGTYERKVAKSDAGTATFGGQTHTGSQTRAWKLEYIPASAWAYGQPMVKGSVAIDGTFDIDMDNHGLNGLVTTPVALTVDPACPSRVTAGELKVVETDGSHTRTVDVQWTACGQRTVTVTIN